VNTIRTKTFKKLSVNFFRASIAHESMFKGIFEKSTIKKD